MIFGITEAGDASRDYSWTEKVNDTDMSVIITKHITDEFIEKVLPFKNKVVIHATCTGYGGTVLEPNVPDYKVQLDAVKKLIKSGFPASQIVVRIDPIIPTAKGIKNIEKMNKKMPVLCFSPPKAGKNIHEKSISKGLTN